jgi:nitrate/nitrite transport system ATP-binding protein
VRNHLIDFLVERSRTFKDARPAGYDRKAPPVVTPRTLAPTPTPTPTGDTRAA